MRKEDLDKYDYLWAEQDNPWVLAGGEVIYNTVTKLALILENEELYAAVKLVMKQKGVRSIDVNEM